ncbi:hypothetical protein Esi_0125_0039 [Ectocarpus siliculosus]|uniref:Uncharacterized protein n=1 Tax=Ectocarpus siliculosus TaxID=2880 RepID=D7FJ09_ECTSI|nr:hypothetical protein Esi_0125_0039 [Ectocarpus siliculosus]|eukprot:CBJ49048.1 hypothetical protein Esi_0125_0039 [Ectocarpus siliculosus]
MTDSGFEKPEFYNFPPFFTLQPVLATRVLQSIIRDPVTVADP